MVAGVSDGCEIEQLQEQKSKKAKKQKSKKAKKQKSKKAKKQKSKKAKKQKSKRLGVTRLGRVALACCASSRPVPSRPYGAIIADAGAMGMAGSGQKRAAR
ncbi:hypothetical protein [Stutzerimonas nitrititolerans]|uniref:hypothetical protein n=1 Tax=Stutzerimonas nitrititolerans TaxID=2482751 RepID=UPI002649AE88|nr:hypothetical protein [Stutzerimonas nitrititolerans]